MSIAYAVDTSEIMHFAEQFANGPKIVQEEMLSAMGVAVTDLYGDVKDVTPRCRTGNLQASLQKQIQQGGSSITGIVETLSSVAPYNKYVLNGRGPVVAGPGKMLRLVLCDGTVLFRKRVGPAKANDFLGKGFAKASPGISKRFDQAADKIVFRLVR
jgi:hypothetical protein